MSASREPAPSRRVVANLDVEDSWARLCRPGLPRPQLKRAARKRIAALGSLLRVFCGPGDRLWLVDRLDGSRLPQDDLPLPILESPETELQPVGDTLPWGLAPEWTESTDETTGPSPTSAARANDRAHTLDLARRLGVDLPGSRLIRSVAELEDAVSFIRSSSTGTPNWVLKAPLCAAGRHRLLSREGLPAVSPKAVPRLLRAHGELVFEPWLDRTDDYGALFDVDDDGRATDLSFHRQRVDSRGGFLGIEILPTADGLPAPTFLSFDEHRRMVELASGVAEALGTVGYRGPVGIDFWRYRHQDETILNPLGEINARLTFGRVARALLHRLFPNLGPDFAFDLRFARGPDPPADLGPDDEARPLLRPGSDDGTAAWAVRCRIR